jgi:methionine-rich copper-binding protein CopC
MRRSFSVSIRFIPAFCILLLLSIVSIVTVGTAGAHAHLVSSNPADGAVLTSEPGVVTAVYGEETSLTKTTFEVSFAKDAASAPRKVADGKVDVNQRTNVSASLPAGLGDGIYTVKWHTLTEDDNGLADGTFSFTVSGSAPSTGSNTPPATGNSGNSGSALPTTGNPSGLPWLTAFLVGLILLCSGVLLRARTQS